MQSSIGHVQVLLNMLRGYTPQAALDAPRFCIASRNIETYILDGGLAGDSPSEVHVEEGVDEATRVKLRGEYCIFNSS